MCPWAMTTASPEVASAAAVVAPDLFRLRPMRPSDEAFVRDSWRRDFEQEESDRFPTLAEYITAQGAIISHCLARSAVTVACNPDDEDQIFGWVCARRFADVKGRMVVVVHYLYVKRCFRPPEFGVTEALWQSAADGAERLYCTQRCDATRGRAITSPWMIFS